MSEQQYRGTPLNPAQFREVATRVDDKKAQEIREAEAERIARVEQQSNHKAEIPEAPEAPEPVRNITDISRQNPTDAEPVPEGGLVFHPDMVKQLKVAGFAVGGGILVGIALAYVVKQSRRVDGGDQGS